MDKLDCNAEEIEHERFQFKLTISLGESSTYYYGVGVKGVAEGAQWYDPVDGMPMSAPIADAVRGWLRAKAEYYAAMARKAEMDALLNPPTPPPPEEPPEEPPA